MSAALPSNLHAELALDRGRLSRDGSERSATRSFTRANATAMDPHARVQSVHGDIIVETAVPFAPSEKHGVIAEEEEPLPEPASGVLSGAELAAALDQEDDGEDDDDDEVIRDRRLQPQFQPSQHQGSFSPRQASLNNSAASQQQHAHEGAYPKSILPNPSRTATLSPPPRSSSCSAPASPPPQQQAFPDRPRFTLTDSGPTSAPPSPGALELGQGADGHPTMRRAVSDSHPHSAPNSPRLGVTPPMRRGAGTHSQPSTPKYNTFEEMGIQGKGAEKEKDCVIM